jgi:hypothetical protein
VPIVRNERQQVTQEETSAPVRRPRSGATSASPKGRGKAAEATEQGQQVAANAADKGKEVAGVAGDSAREVAGVVREQATQLTQELTAQGRTLYEETRQQVESQAEYQTQSLARALHRLGTETQALAEGRPADAGSLATYAEQCAEKLHQVAWEIEDRGVEGLVEDLGGFARRRPGAFLVGAALIGFGGGRLIRSAGSSSDSGQGQMAVEGGIERGNGNVARRPARRRPAPARRSQPVGAGSSSRNPAAMGGE